MYGSVEDLEAMIAHKFTVSSSPTRAQVVALMDMHSEVLTVLLRARGVPVPATGTPAYKYLTRIVLLKTAADVLRRAAMEAGAASAPLADSYERQSIELTEHALNNPAGLIET